MESLKSRLLMSMAVASGLSSMLGAQAPDTADRNSTKAIILKHLTVSRDFTLKVADQMPAADFEFKLTPPQMSFGDQFVHIAQTFEEFVAPLSGKSLDLGKPTSMSKPDVIAYVKKSFDRVIETVGSLTPDQLSKMYKGYGVTATGLDFMLELLDHTTQHRASAEMYLRVKGITPTAYEF
jgi:uncharacterized damage-inducible protein DinB